MPHINVGFRVEEQSARPSASLSPSPSTSTNVVRDDDGSESALIGYDDEDGETNNLSNFLPSFLPSFLSSEEET